MQYVKIRDIREGNYAYNVLSRDGGKGSTANGLYYHFLENIMKVPGTGVFFSSSNNTGISMDKTEYGILCVDKTSNELLGYLFSRNIGTGRENEIMVVCSHDPLILRTLIQKHKERMKESLDIKCITFIPDKKELIDIYEECGFIIVDKLKSRFPTESDVVKMTQVTEE